MDQLADFRFFSQYAGASQCNGDVAAGSAIACASNGCPEVEAAGATVVDTFTYVASPEPYHMSEELDQELTGSCLSGVVTDIQGFVAKDDVNKLIVVSYKGSTSLRNYLAE